MEPLTIGSLNLKNSLTLSEMRADLSKYIRSCEPEILGLQEMAAEWRDDLFNQVNFAGYSFYREDTGTDAGGNPIAWWSARFDLLDANVRDLQKDGYTWWRKNGPPVEDTYASIIKLRDRETLRYVNVLNTHIPPSIQDGNGSPSESNNRLAAAYAITTGIKRWVKRQPSEEAVIVIGDFNWDAKHANEKYNPQNRLPMLISQFEYNGETKYGTLGKRDIDYIFLRRDCLYHRPGHSATVGKLKTDHNGVYWDTLLG